MTRLKRFVIAMTAAATVAVGSLTVVPTASALPFEVCYGMSTLHDAYEATGWAFYEMGYYATANYWFGRAAFEEAHRRARCGY
jgi:hypothetical protein